MTIFFCMIFSGKTFALCLAPLISGFPSTSTFAGGSGGEYNVYDPAEYIQTVNYQVTTVAGIGGCRYFMVLSAGNSGSATARRLVLGADTLSYNIYTTASKSSIFNSTGSYNNTGTLSGNFPFILNLLQSNDHSLYWTIAPQQVVKSNAARFQDVTLSLSLYGELALGIFTLTDVKTITFQSKVESNIDLSLVDSGGALDIGDNTQSLNFGNLSSGQVLSYDTIIRSNSGYTIKMQSQNAQKLMHQFYPSVNASIPYMLSFNGGAINLSSGSPVQVASSTGVTSDIGMRFATQFTIGTMTGAEPTGTYQDMIMLTVSAN